MLKNYIRIAWRSILNNRFYSVINIIGLSTGLAFTLLIAAYVWSELQVNTRLKNNSRQYIIQSKWKNPNQGIELTSIGMLAKALKEEYPHLVKNYYRWDGITSVISSGDKSFREGIQVGDSTMFEMYGFKLLHGDAKTVFQHPFSLVLNTEKAIKYFGKTDVVGQTLTIESFSGTRHDFNVAGVIEKSYRNSVTNITADNNNGFYIPVHDIAFFGRNIDSWQNPYIVSYIETAPGVNPKAVEEAMKQLLKQHAGPEIAGNLTPYLVSLKDYYLTANNGLIKKLLYALSAVAFFILLMAVINFINMSVSRSVKRMREIGIRKVLGGLKQQLILQFLIESVLLVLMATVAALGIYLLTKGVFGRILGVTLPGLDASPVYLAACLVTLVIVVGVIAGIYPAFVLSSFKAVESLKGKLTSVKENVLLRKSLVGFQFGIAAIVLAGAIIISQQVKLFFSKDLGYNKDYVISATVPRNWSSEGVRRMEQVRNKIAELPQVINVSLSYEIPNGNNAGVFAMYRYGSDPASAVQTQSVFTDEYYATTYGIPMAAGDFYGPQGAIIDSSKVVISKKMADALGWRDPAEAIGQQVMNRGDNRIFTIAGVTNDFHFTTMQQGIEPLTFYNVRAFTTFRFFSIKLRPGDVQGSIAAVAKKWTQLMPAAPFEYTFMDDTLKKLYRTEIQLQQASYAATTLSLIIVLLGILGLVALSVQKRTREIGIRKVLGSSVRGIIALFMKDLLGTILVSGLIACPVAWFLMDGWLSDYAVRIEVTPIPFIIAVVLLGFIAAVLIVVQTIRTAVMNPVTSLRAE